MNLKFDPEGFNMDELLEQDYHHLISDRQISKRKLIERLKVAKDNKKIIRKKGFYLEKDRIYYKIDKMRKKTRDLEEKVSKNIHVLVRDNMSFLS